MDAQTLEIKQTLMRERVKQRGDGRRRKMREPIQDHDRLIEIAKRRLLAYKFFCQGFTPTQIARKINSTYNLKTTAERVEDLIADGFPLRD